MCVTFYRVLSSKTAETKRARIIPVIGPDPDWDIAYPTQAPREIVARQIADIRTENHPTRRERGGSSRYWASIRIRIRRMAAA